MEFSQAQNDVRRAYLYGAPGMFVSGLLWLLTAALVQRGDVTRAMVALFVGGMFIFPLSALLTRALGGAATLPKGHPMLALAMQLAFIVPVGWPIVVAAGMTREAWYFAAAAVLVAVHYFPFMSLYGMRLFGVLAVALLGGVFASIALAPGSVAASAWSTGAVEVIFACVAMMQWRAQRGAQPGYAAASPGVR